MAMRHWSTNGYTILAQSRIRQAGGRTCTLPGWLCLARVIGREPKHLFAIARDWGSRDEGDPIAGLESEALRGTASRAAGGTGCSSSGKGAGILDPQRREIPAVLPEGVDRDKPSLFCHA